MEGCVLNLERGTEGKSVGLGIQEIQHQERREVKTEADSGVERDAIGKLLW